MDEDNPFTKAQTIDPEVRAYVYSLVNAVCFTLRARQTRILMLISLVEVAQTMMAATYLAMMRSQSSEISSDGSNSTTKRTTDSTLRDA